MFEEVCRDITEELTFGPESEKVRKQVIFQVRWGGNRVPPKQRPKVGRLGADEAGKVCWDLIVNILCFIRSNLCLIPRQSKMWEGTLSISLRPNYGSKSVFLRLWHIRSHLVLPAARLLLALMKVNAVEVIFS